MTARVAGINYSFAKNQRAWHSRKIKTTTTGQFEFASSVTRKSSKLNGYLRRD
jgi:hypothetical protein